MMSIFLGMNWDNEPEKETPAHILYGEGTAKDEQQKRERNQLIDNLGSNYRNEHMFASNERLKEINNELLAQNKTDKFAPAARIETGAKNNTQNNTQNKPAFEPVNNSIQKQEVGQNIFNTLQNLIQANDKQRARIQMTSGDVDFKEKYAHNIDAARNYDLQKTRANSKANDEKAEKEKPKTLDGPRFNEDLHGKKMIEGSKGKAQKDKFETNVKINRALINAAGAPSAFGRVIGTMSGKGADTVGMLHLAQGMNLPIYTKDALKLQNTNDKQMSEFNNGELNQFKSHIEDKIKEQFKDFGYKPEDVGGYVFKSNSAPVKRIKESADFKDMVAKNLHNIADGENFRARFQEHKTNFFTNRKNNLHTAFGSVDFLNAGFDKDGNLKLYMFDTYDFNKGENPKVEAGRRLMQEGKLKGYYSLHEIVLSPQELEEIVGNTRYDEWHNYQD